MLRRLIVVTILSVIIGLFAISNERSSGDSISTPWQSTLGGSTFPLPMPLEALCNQKAPLPQEGAQAWFINPTPRYGEAVWLCVRFIKNGLATWAEANVTTYYQTNSNEMRQGDSGMWKLGREGVRALNFTYPDAKPHTPISLTVTLYNYENPVKPYLTYAEYIQPDEPFPYLTQLRKVISSLHLLIRHTVAPLSIADNPWFSAVALSGWLFILVGLVINQRHPLRQIYSEGFKGNRMFFWLACASLSFSYILVLVHFLRANTFPYSANPLEIRYVEQRLMWNFVIQLFSTGVIGWKSKGANRLVDGYQLRMVISCVLFAVLASTTVNMVYNTSLCCENPLATYWGFPFSWLVGIAKDPPFARFDHWTTFAYVSHYAGQIYWRVNPWKLIADFLFWWAIVVSVGLLLWRKRSQW